MAAAKTTAKRRPKKAPQEPAAQISYGELEATILTKLQAQGVTAEDVTRERVAGLGHDIVAADRLKGWRAKTWAPRDRWCSEGLVKRLRKQFEPAKGERAAAA